MKKIIAILIAFIFIFEGTGYSLRVPMASGKERRFSEVYGYLDATMLGTAEKQYTFPNLEAISNQRKIGGFQQHLSKPNPSQSSVPYDQDILTKLGIEVGDRIFGIAGYTGDWLSELKRCGADIVYTDIDPVIVKWVIEHRASEFGGKIRVGDPLKEPTEVSFYDWMFTYEALPLVPDEWTLVLLRSLMNKKGMIWINSIGETAAELSLLKGFAAIYSLTGIIDLEEGRESESHPENDVNKRVVMINTTYGQDVSERKYSSRPKPFLVVTLKTNEILRKQARNDIAIIEALQSFKGKTQNELEEYLKYLNIEFSKEELQASLSRVTALASLLETNLRTTIKFEPIKEDGIMKAGLRHEVNSSI